MPKINRIRIANVSYSGKFIADEMIDLYEGENLLINLANGSGKSVLTQMIMQPILPTVKLHQRKIESYLAQKEPTFIMLEWILDNTAISTYLLTGIVMNKAITEDNNTRVKYFTFINKYTSANDFDIKNIDLINEENGIIKYKSYDYCIKLLKEQMGSKSEIQVFTRDDASEYKQVLAEYGIFKDEWKILASINENEGGVDELFTKCGTSDKLIDEWILKTISNNLDTGEKLQEMFAQLIETIIDKESQIQQKEELSSFKHQAEKYNDELSELLENIDQEEAKKREIEDIYLKLYRQENEKNAIISQLESKIKDLEEEKKQIDYEEVSEEYYKTKSNLEAAIEQLEKSEAKQEKEQQKYNELNLRLRIIQAAGVYSELKELKAKNEEYVIKKKKLEDSLESKEIEDIRYSLKKVYENEIDVKNIEISNLEEKLATLNNKQIQNNEKQEKCEQENKTALEKQTEIKTKMNIFKANEKEIFIKLRITLSRNIFEEIDEKEKIKVLDLYDSTIKQIQEESENAEQEINKKEESIQINKNRCQELENEKSDIQEKLSGKDFEQENYKTMEKKLKDVLKNLAIEYEKMWERDTNLIDVNRRKENTRNQKEEINYELNQKQEMMSSLENGGIHIQGSLGKIFKNQNIDYTTGEDYLKDQNNSYQQQILSKNPMLPYCYIVKDQDYEKIEKLNINEELTRLTPIITYRDIDQDFEPVNKIINMTQKAKFVCLYNKSSFDEFEKDKFKENLVKEIEELKQQNKVLEDKLFELEKSYEIIEEFKYEKNYYDRLLEDIKNLTEKLDNNKKNQAELNEKNENLNKEISNSKLQIQENKNKISECERKKEEFLEFLKQNDEYMLNIQEKKKYEDILKQLEEKQESLKSDIKELGIKITDTKDAIKREKENKDSLSIALSQIPEVKDAKFLEKTKEELEKMYEEINSKIQGNKEEIEKEMNSISKDIIKKSNYIEKNYKDLEGQYEEITYTEDEEDKIVEECSDQGKNLNFANDECTKAKEDKIRKEEKQKAVNDNLKRMDKEEPCAGHLIKGKYEERKNANKQNIQDASSEMIKTSKEINEIKTMRNKLLRTIDIPEMREVKEDNFDYNKISIDELKNQYDVLKNKNDEAKRKINNYYNEIKNQNKGTNQVINSFLDNMNPYQGDKEFADYYFVFERVSESLDTMTKILAEIETSLKHIEDDKNSVKHNAFVQGKSIYMEMKKISESANVKMPGKIKKVPLLEIELPKELDAFAEERINDYIEECIKTLRDECKKTEENKQSLIDKKVKEWLSDRELLNKVINSETIEVKLYKIDISEKNSGLRKWKDVIVGNSGGEKFISCLILVIALIQYNRTKVFERVGNDGTMETTKIFIMDNPFGKMSSKHLLEGLTSILEKFNVQAICLSDISQSSITNQFQVVYQMSLKTGQYTDKSYLTTDNVTTNGQIAKNYLLEQAYVRKKEEQIRLF